MPQSQLSQNFDADGQAFGRIAHRQLLLVHHSDPLLQSLCEQVSHHEHGVINCLGSSTNTDGTRAQRQQHLGSESLLIIYPLNSQFDPNHFCAVCDTLLGGGLLILVLQFTDLRQAKAHTPLLCRMLNNLCQNSTIDSLKPSAPGSINNLITRGLQQRAKLENLHLCATTSQRQAADMIHQLAASKRKRQLLIEGGRGRGKSAIIGAQLATLAVNSRVELVVTATHPGQCSTLIRQFKHHLKAGHFSQFPADKMREIILPNGSRLRSVTVERLLAQKPEARLLVVEEAASIPVAKLREINAHYKRVIFSTTTYGYEGQGRGFEHRFIPQLNPNRFKRIALQQPVRWHQEDFIESALFRAFLLDTSLEQTDTSPAQTNTSPGVNDSHSTHHQDGEVTTEGLAISRFHAQQLSQDENVLRQVFALLINAHYKTTLKDLERLLRDDCDIWLVQQKNLVVGVVLTYSEGELKDGMAEKLISANHKPKGNLTPQLLCWYHPCPDLAREKYRRIYRIAVSLPYRRQGIATQLINKVRKFSLANNEILSTCFAIEQGLLSFWKANGFTTILLSQTLSGNSGEPSVLMLDESTAEKNELVVSLMHNTMARTLIDSDKLLKTLQPPSLIASLLLSTIPKSSSTNGRKERHKSQSDLIHLYLNNKRPLSVCRYQIRNVLIYHLNAGDLSPCNGFKLSEIGLVCTVFLLGAEPASIYPESDFASRAELENFLKSILKRMLQ